MTSEIHQAVWDWLTGCPHIRDLFFHFSRTHSGDTVLVPLTTGNDTEIRSFIGGSERRYSFALVRIDSVSDAPNSDENLSALLDAEQLARWVQEQDAAGCYPELPRGYSINGMTVQPSGAYSAEDEGRVRFMLQFSIDYLKEAT